MILGIRICAIVVTFALLVWTMTRNVDGTPCDNDCAHCPFPPCEKGQAVKCE